MPRARRRVASSSSIAAGQPKMWTGSRPAVRSPAAASIGRRVDRQSVAGSTSQKTGRASSNSRQLDEAMKLSGVVRTSSPRPHPSSRTARWSAAVPLETATASSTPRRSAKSRLEARQHRAEREHARAQHLEDELLLALAEDRPRERYPLGAAQASPDRRRRGVRRSRPRPPRGWKAYSSESTSASHEASMTFSETPIELHDVERRRRSRGGPASPTRCRGARRGSGP